MELDFTKDLAATFAQITAVLLLAVAFVPEYRGSLGRKIIRGEEGEVYAVPARHRSTRIAGIYRLIAVFLSLVALFVDSLVLIGAAVPDGFVGWLTGHLNHLSVTLLLGCLAADALIHVVFDTKDSR